MAALKDQLTLTERVALLEKFVLSQFGDFFHDFLRQQAELTEKSDVELSTSPPMTFDHSSFNIASKLNCSMSLYSYLNNSTDRTNRETNCNKTGREKVINTGVASLERTDLVPSSNTVKLKKKNDRVFAADQKPQLEIQSGRQKASSKKTSSKKICAKNFEDGGSTSEQLSTSTVPSENRAIAVSKLARSPSQKKVHDVNKKCKCRVCGKYLSTLGNLKIHLHRHNGFKPFECTHCYKKFFEKTNLTRHMRIHTGEMPFQCNICEKSFSRKQSLEYHVRVHTGEKPYKCTLCFKSFSVSGNLKTHIRVHKNANLHECIFCAKTFACKNALENHVRSHTGETPFECKACGKSYTQKGNLKTHKKKSHCAV